MSRIEGSIQLSFAEEPLELRRWTVFDAAGPGDARGAGEAPDRACALDRELFRFRNPQFYPGARN